MTSANPTPVLKKTRLSDILGGPIASQVPYYRCPVWALLVTDVPVDQQDLLLIGQPLIFGMFILHTSRQRKSFDVMEAE